jgi:hypothetical protein
MFALTACPNKKDEPPPPAKPTSETKKEPEKKTAEKADEQKQKNNQQGQVAPGGGKTADNQQPKKNGQAPATGPGVTTGPRTPPVSPLPPSEAASIPKVINPQDDVAILLTKFFVESEPDAIENARKNLVDEVFSEEGEAQGKVVEIQALIAKLERSGLYSPEVKSRVAYLQNGVADHVREDRNYDLLQKGAFIVGTGIVGGTLAGTGAYRLVGKIPSATKTAYLASQSAVREGISKAYAGTRTGLTAVKNTVGSREALGATYRDTKEAIVQAGRSTVNATVETGAAVKNAVTSTARRAFRSSETVVRDHLEDLGLSQAEREVFAELAPVARREIPVGTEFFATPKATFKYAVLDTWDGQPLGLNRVVVFKTKRLIRGSPIEANFASNRIPADQAGELASKLAVQEVEGPSRTFVHFMNMKTGTVSALRWPVDKFVALLSGAGRTVKPIFTNMDVPTAVGTALATTGAMGVIYWYGLDDGEDQAHEDDAINLERMLRPQEKPAVSAELRR